MAEISTLTSLAMLKVNSDIRNQDYIEYLRPFVLFVLGKSKLDPVIDSDVARLILNEFGLKIPNRAIHLILRRFARGGFLEKKLDIFHVIRDIPDANIELQRTEAHRHMQVVVTNLVEYSKTTPYVFDSEEAATKSLLIFLSNFSIDCLRTYIFGTALPDIPEKNNKGIVLISKFIKDIRQQDKPLFESFMVIVKGHMLANALICPDLDSQRQAFKKVKFYLDTPFVIKLLGLAGPEEESAVLETIELVQSLGGKLVVFEHTHQEIYNVIRGSAEYIDHPDGRGSIVIECRRTGKTRTDMLLISEKLDGELLRHSITRQKTPSYKFDLQIDEVAFEDVLEDEIDYYNEKAKLFDINSVRSIYVLRHGRAPVRLEDANSVLVTSNTSFAIAAYKYGRQFEETREVSSVITDFSLANIAWLKRPLKAENLPQSEIIAYAYAALNPNNKLWVKYLAEIEKLRERKDISSDDHATLRYSIKAREELMNLTLGDEEALNKNSVTVILERATSHIREEMDIYLRTEEEAHNQTKNELASQIHKQAQFENRLDGVCQRIGLVIAVVLFVLLTSIVITGAVLSLVGGQGWFITLPIVAFAVMTVSNLMFGVTVRRMFKFIRKKCTDVVRDILITNSSSVKESEKKTAVG